jgi:hypothetical protein
MKKYFTSPTRFFFHACQTFQNRTGTVGMVQQPMTDVYLDALIEMEDIVSVICETWLDKQ